MPKKKAATEEKSDNGNVTVSETGGVALDERMRQRLEFLDSAGEILAGSLEFKTTLSNVARLAVPRIADWCAIDLCGGDYCDDTASVQRLIVTHVDPSKIDLAFELERRYPPDPNSPSGVHNVLRTGVAEFMREIPEELLTAAAIDEEHLSLIRRLGLVSAMVVPLTARGRTLGALTLVSAESGQLFDEYDLSLAEELARRAGMAIDNAILYRQAQDAQSALRHQLDFTSTMMASLGEGVYALDADGHVSYMNPAAQSMLGWSFEELAGRNMHDAIHYRDADGNTVPATACPLLDVTRSGVPYSNDDDIFIRRDGSPLHVAYTCAPLFTNGKVQGAILAFHDITERLYQQRELQAQQEWLTVTLSSIGDAVIATDTTGAVIFMNDVARQMTGWRGEEGVGESLTTVFRIVNEETGAPAENPVVRVLETEGIVGMANHTMLVSRDGREIPIDDSAAPIRDPSGKMIGVILVFHDVTDRRRAEDAMRRSNLRISRILESIGDAFVALDREWQFTYVNQRAEEIFATMRKEPGRLVGKVIWGALPEMIWSDLYEQFHRAVREQVPGAFEMQYGDGGWLSIHVYPSLDGLSVFLQDITSRKTIEADRSRLLEEVELGRNRIDNIIATIPGVVWEAWGEPDVESQKIDYVSEYVETMLGYTVEEWISTPNFWLTIVHPDDREEAAETAARAFQNCEKGINRFRWMRKDGEPILVEAHSTVIVDGSGNPIGMRGVTMDISERG
jgi:PAS domain S-box-containing protein